MAGNDIETMVPQRTPNTVGRAAWICLLLAWVMFVLPIPFVSGLSGWSLNLAAFILAIIAIAKHGARAGIWQLLASLILSPLIYWGLVLGFLAAAVSHAASSSV